MQDSITSDSKDAPQKKSDDNNQPPKEFVDSFEAKQNAGKRKQDLKMKSILKEKLKVTSVPNIKLENDEGEVCLFKDLFTFHEFLGVGSFGFVVKAEDVTTGEMYAVKIIEAS